MEDASKEKYLVLDDYSELLKNSLMFLKNNFKGVIHTNRTINTGWNQFKFDYSLTDENSMRFIIVRVIRKQEDLLLLKLVLCEVDELVNSGIHDNQIIFMLDVFINSSAKRFAADVKELTSSFRYIKNVKFI